MTSSLSTIVDIQSVLQQFSSDAQDLYVPNIIAELHETPTAMEFLRNYVMTNVPVVIRGGVQHWPALKKWTDEYLCESLGECYIPGSTWFVFMCFDGD